MITNISSGGCQAVLEAEEARLLPTIVPDQQVTMAFTMFGQDAEEHVRGEVKNITISDTRQFIGVKFNHVSETVKSQIEEYIQNVTTYLGA
jgi:c-di-GMP-binding flagellar brake protein YcgR